LFRRSDEFGFLRRNAAYPLRYRRQPPIKKSRRLKIAGLERPAVSV